MTLNGSSVLVGAPDDSAIQLLFILNTQCPLCRRSLPAWSEIAERLGESERSVNILVASLDDLNETRQYVGEHSLNVPVFLFPDGRLRHLYRAYFVPAVVAVNDRGAVEYARVGVLETQSAIDSVLDALKAQSPAGETVNKEFSSAAPGG